MSQYVCDICSMTVARSAIKFHTAATMQRAIRDGLNPWKTPGINMSVSAGLAGLGSAFGLDSDELYRVWRERAMADTTDWGLCSACTRAVGRGQGPGQPMAADVRREPARDVANQGSVSGAAPPDWYPDPSGRHQHRYWDGAAWTDHVASGGSQSLDQLEGAPASDDQASAKTGAQAIVEETGIPAVEPLIAALGDPDVDVRASAAAALVQISAPGFEPLIAALKDQNKDVRAFAAVTLGQIGDAAVEPLIVALKQYPDKRSGVAQILGQIGDPRAVEPLIVALKDQNDYVRQWAAHALGKIGDPRAVEPLSAALKDQNEDVRKWAAYALGKIGVPTVEIASLLTEP